MPSSYRIGHGYDIHRLVPGRPLVLGGVRFATDYGLEGHSDADCLARARARVVQKKQHGVVTKALSGARVGRREASAISIGYSLKPVNGNSCAKKE